jgi:hypothetical protein
MFGFISIADPGSDVARTSNGANRKSTAIAALISLMRTTKRFPSPRCASASLSQ